MKKKLENLFLGVVVFISTASVALFLNAIWTATTKTSGNVTATEVSKCNLQNNIPVNYGNKYLDEQVIQIVYYKQSPITKQCLPRFSPHSKNKYGCEYITGIKLKFTQNLFGNADIPPPRFNGMDRTVQTEELMRDIANNKLFIYPSPTTVNIEDKTIIVEYSNDKDRIEKQVNVLLTELPKRFSIKLIKN